MNKITPRRLYAWTSRRARTLPILRKLKDTQYNNRLRTHAAHLRPLHPDDLPLLETLRRDGICVLPVRDFGWPETDAMLDQLETLSRELRAGVPSGSRLGVSWSRMAEAPAVRDWGLSARALALAHNYIELPLFYGGTQTRRECVGGEPVGTRNWHIDMEDRRVLKLILYANDVSEGGGPFEYLPLPVTRRAAERLGYTVGLVKDATLASVGVGAADRIAVPGARHTAILVDTGRLFHRAQPPQKSDRITTTYCWMSIFGDRDHHARGRVIDAA